MQFNVESRPMSGESTSRRNFLRQLSCTLCAGGVSTLLPQLNLISSALAQSTVPGYRALVCVYFAGGNDAWNTLIPYDQARYDVYAASRGGVYSNSNTSGLALDRSALAATTINDASGSYALHPSAVDRSGPSQPGLRSLYNQGRLALITNIGPLIQPITKAEYNSTPALRPPQLYSHSDQENLWHIGRTTTNTRGWGGQIADRVSSGNLNTMLSPCISIGGGNRFEVGNSTFPYQMSSSGLSGLSGMTGTSTEGSARRGALAELLNASYASPYQDEYKKVFKRSRDLYDLLNEGLASGGIGNVTTDFPTQNSLADQLKMVARMIKLSRDTSFNIQHSRQIYYVRIGGFDMHDNLMSAGSNGHANLLSRVSQALGAFWTALGEIGAQNEVTTFTMSEFARTLSTNGNGSDHAWGSVNMIMGGAVQGGHLYGTFPNQTLDGPISLSRGQFIPSTSVDQMAATLARWMGVTSNTDLNTIFPNLPNFSTNNLGFMQP
jgi:uncharacterized protein (DUF1501 family)